jgi:hypothetical protein
MVRRMLDATGFKCIVGCHFSEISKGLMNFARHGQHEVAVMILDISPPYKDNWDIFTTPRDGKPMADRSLVLAQRTRRGSETLVDEVECLTGTP